MPSSAQSSDVSRLIALRASRNAAEVNPESLPVGIAAGETARLQRGPQRSGDPYRFIVVDFCEEIDVVGRPGDKAVRDHRPAAGQGQGASFGQVQRCPRDEVLQRVKRHQIRQPREPSRSTAARPP